MCSWCCGFWAGFVTRPLNFPYVVDLRPLLSWSVVVEVDPLKLMFSTSVLHSCCFFTPRLSGFSVDVSSNVVAGVAQSGGLPPDLAKILAGPGLKKARPSKRRPKPGPTMTKIMFSVSLSSARPGIFGPYRAAHAWPGLVVVWFMDLGFFPWQLFWSRRFVYQSFPARRCFFVEFVLCVCPFIVLFYFVCLAYVGFYC